MLLYMKFSEFHFQIDFSVLNTNGFCMLISYPAILLNSFIILTEILEVCL